TDVEAQENRVEIPRAGIVEWYVNSAAGLEQGFTVEARPAGDGALVVELAVADARPSQRGDAIAFTAGAQRTLRYGELIATDADHRPLSAHLEVASADHVRIIVDDSAATYPVAIDPLLTSTADTQLESNQSNAQLGFSVAGAGDVNGDGYADVIVGSPEENNGQTGEGTAAELLGNGRVLGRPVLARQRRGNGSGIAVQPFGLAQSSAGFAAELRATHPQGTGRVKAQLQACPPGVPFGNGSGTNVLTPTWVTVNGATPEVLLSQTFSGLVHHTLYRWRARILQIPKTGPIPINPAHGPWRRLGAQSEEADIRLPEPGFALSLASSAALLAALARRRSRS